MLLFVEVVGCYGCCLLLFGACCSLWLLFVACRLLCVLHVHECSVVCCIDVCWRLVVGCSLLVIGLCLVFGVV